MNHMESHKYSMVGAGRDQSNPPLKQVHLEQIGQEWVQEGFESESPSLEVLKRWIDEIPRDMVQCWS